MKLGIFKNKLDSQNVFKTITDMVDDTRLTEEEAARINVIKAEKTIEYAVKSSDENSIRSKARRVIAFMVIGYVGIMGLTGTIFSILDKPEVVASILKVATAFNMGAAFVSVIAFYFGGYYLNKLNPWSKENKEVKTK